MDPQELETLAALEGRHWWYAARRDLLRLLAGPAPAGARALDVGANAGGNTSVLQELGWRAVSSDLAEVGPAIAASRGVPALRADLTALPFADRSFDLVVAFDVLEHITDDARAAAECRRVLRPGGRALIAVPADPALWSPHDEAVGHVRRYLRPELVSVVEQSGLTVDDVWSWNVLLRPVVALRRKRIQGSDLTPVSGPVNLVLRTVLRAEAHLPWLRTRRGVSLVLTAGRR